MSRPDPHLVMVAGFLHGLLESAATDTVAKPGEIEPVLEDGYVTEAVTATVYGRRVRITIHDEPVKS